MLASFPYSLYAFIVFMFSHNMAKTAQHKYSRRANDNQCIATMIWIVAGSRQDINFIGVASTLN
jgi:hypothetical protein